MAIVPLDPDDPAVLAFLEARAGPRGAAHWRWKYRAHPDGLPPGFAWRDGAGTVLGCIGLMWTALHTRTGAHRAAWFVDWHVAPDPRAVGVGLGLLRTAEAAAGTLLTLQGSADTRQILPRLGWRETGHGRTYVRRLTLAAALAPAARRLPPRPGAALRAAARVLPAGRPARRVPLPAGVALEPVTRFPPEHDAVWRERVPEFAPALRRDAAYLNYLIADYPGGGYQAALLRRDGAAVGHLVTRRDTDRRGLRRGRIVDLLWPRGARPLLEGLVAAACRTLRAAGADYVECLASVPDLQAALAAAGFRERRAVPLWWHRVPADAGDPADWFLTLLDCDRAYR